MKRVFDLDVLENLGASIEGIILAQVADLSKELFPIEKVRPHPTVATLGTSLEAVHLLDSFLEARRSLGARFPPLCLQCFFHPLGAPLELLALSLQVPGEERTLHNLTDFAFFESSNEIDDAVEAQIERGADPLRFRLFVLLHVVPGLSPGIFVHAYDNKALAIHAATACSARLLQKFSNSKRSCCLSVVFVKPVQDDGLCRHVDAQSERGRGVEHA